MSSASSSFLPFSLCFDSTMNCQTGSMAPDHARVSLSLRRRRHFPTRPTSSFLLRGCEGFPSTPCTSKNVHVSLSTRKRKENWGSLSLSRRQYSFRLFNSFPFLFRRPQRSAGRSSRAGTGRTTALEKQWYRERENTHPPIPTTLILPSPFFRSSSARGIV